MWGSSSTLRCAGFGVAFSTAADARIPASTQTRVLSPPVLNNEAVSPLFQAVVEATEEAVYNSLFMAKTTTGFGGRTIEALPIEKVLDFCRKFNMLREVK